VFLTLFSRQESSFSPLFQCTNSCSAPRRLRLIDLNINQCCLTTHPPALDLPACPLQHSGKKLCGQQHLDKKEYRSNQLKGVLGFGVVFTRLARTHARFEVFVNRNHTTDRKRRYRMTPYSIKSTPYSARTLQAFPDWDYCFTGRCYLFLVPRDSQFLSNITNSRPPSEIVSSL
jgi:hypothetical protein